MSAAATEKRKQLFIPPELSAPREVDEKLSAEEFFAISVFADIRDPKRRKELERRLGQRSAVLRYYDPGETVILQGDAGETAFYVLTEEDVVSLRRHQIAAVEAARSAESAIQEDDSDAMRKKFAGALEHRLAGLGPVQRVRSLEYWQEEIAYREAVIAEHPNDDDRPPAAFAWLLAAIGGRDSRSAFSELRKRARSLANRLFGAFKKRVRRDQREANRSIPIDAITDIDANTMRGDIGSGEVFGEMSCLHRSPRSATIIADRPCYMVEMLRNVLDQLHLDDSFRERMREKYVERILSSQLRRLSVFQHHTDEQFDWLLDQRYGRLDWVDCETGDVIFEEGQDSDTIYIVHKGLVKVLANVRARFLPEDFDGDATTDSRWASAFGTAGALIAESDAVAAGGEGEAGGGKKPEWPGRLRDAVAEHLRSAFAGYGIDPPDASAGAPDETERAALLAGLNDFVVEGNLVSSRSRPKKPRDKSDPRWETSKAILEDVADNQLEALFSSSSNSTDSWSQLELWLFHRRMLELAFSHAIPERTAGGERRRVLSYVGPGQLLGEIGVMADVLGDEQGRRTATCVAYDHPDRPTDDIQFPDASKGAVTRVEMIGVRRDIFVQLVEASPDFREAIEEIIDVRKRGAAPPKSSKRDQTRLMPSIESQRFEDLGLVQGQQLMLIDLDRCTRCNACVDACVKAHDDGHTRLFLDGPQFQSYLVPLTCRSCLDPVCMIGCPVGSINRGDEGEIRIEPWCIGCNLCANQCPYGSIQMEPLRDIDTKRIESHARSVFLELGESVEDIEFKVPKRQAVVCDLCAQSSSAGPACVHACPHEAAIRVHALETFQEGGNA